LGRRGLPLLRDPEIVTDCDVLITESTYGNRLHPPPEDLRSALKRIIHEAATLEGRVIIPAFSLGRTQQIVCYLNELTNDGELPAVPIFVDSPLSRRLTAVYRHHKDVMDAAVQAMLQTDSDPFGFRGLVYVESPQESKELNRRKGPFVVISASGMCESGRVLHHLKNAVDDAANTIVIIGFQAQHTLGRRIVERQPKLKIFDRYYPLKAKVEVLNGLSAHADANDFRWWFEQLAGGRGIGEAYIVHGEPEAAGALAGILHDYCNENPVIPQLYQSFEV
jgi:metallo-beta-lactamase family protein